MAQLAAVVLVLCALAGPLPADEPAVSAAKPDAAQIETGDRVRVTTKEGVITGTVATLQEGRLELSKASWKLADRAVPRSFLVHQVGKLEESRGKKSNWAIGAGVGGLLGLGLAIAACTDLDCEGGETGEALVVLGGIGAALGAGVGALIRTERWEDVPLDKVRVSVAPLPRGGMGVGVSLSF